MLFTPPRTAMLLAATETAAIMILRQGKACAGDQGDDCSWNKEFAHEAHSRISRTLNTKARQKFHLWRERRCYGAWR